MGTRDFDVRIVIKELVYEASYLMNSNYYFD